MENNKAAIKERPVTQTECRHHWVIDSPNGPVSIGTCKSCGATKEFHNSLFEVTWHGNAKGRTQEKQVRGFEDDGEEDQEDPN